MDSELYHFQRQGKNVRNPGPKIFQEEGPLLTELVATKGPWTSEEIIDCYCRELRFILKNSELQEVVRKILDLERVLEKIRITIPAHLLSSIPNIALTYQKISPLLLRSLSLHTDFNELKADEFMKDLMEVLRVSLEEEFLFWNSKRQNALKS